MIHVRRSWGPGTPPSKLLRARCWRGGRPLRRGAGAAVRPRAAGSAGLSPGLCSPQRGHRGSGDGLSGSPPATPRALCPALPSWEPAQDAPVQKPQQVPGGSPGRGKEVGEGETPGGNTRGSSGSRRAPHPASRSAPSALPPSRRQCRPGPRPRPRAVITRRSEGRARARLLPPPAVLSQSSRDGQEVAARLCRRLRAGWRGGGGGGAGTVPRLPGRVANSYSRGPQAPTPGRVARGRVRRAGTADARAGGGRRAPPLGFAVRLLAVPSGFCFFFSSRFPLCACRGVA